MPDFWKKKKVLVVVVSVGTGAGARERGTPPRTLSSEPHEVTGVGGIRCRTAWSRGPGGPELWISTTLDELKVHRERGRKRARAAV
ncbi:Hypothetical protein SMAX5B_016021 [Scophthalmus maximus]|uniref:Uncharacterized protein n=1 Tax=Scophthalmus maximus TaxID=52904 RepID=A0A2U9CUS3_SCOMX|nr:Hypothetical protein SMAX5B_016021 [Scophthalmus maximus]